MRIAFLSYEFPPDTAIGGIATYTYQMALSMLRLNCEVEVFTASPTRSTSNEVFDGIFVHRVHTDSRDEFKKEGAERLKERHQQKPFAIVEAPEYSAEGKYVRELLPKLPLVVKFHTPSFVIKDFNRALKAHQLKYRLKNLLGIGKYEKEKDPEYQTAIQADGLVAPSASMANIIAERWQIPPERITTIASPFQPPNSLLEIEVATRTNVITYLGRLEGRKGVHLLSKAIPLVLKVAPGTTFRFIGRTNIGPLGKGTMLDYLKTELASYVSQVEFIDHVSSNEIPEWLAKTDICVFPSLWEAYGYVCIEAMSAARGIVASKFGGMNDMLHDIDPALLIDPSDTEALAGALLSLLNNPSQRMKVGEKSRQKVVQYYQEEVPKLHLAYYQKVVEEKNR